MADAAVRIGCGRQVLDERHADAAGNVVTSSPRFSIGRTLMAADATSGAVGLSAGGAVTFTGQFGTASTLTTMQVQTYTVELFKSQQFL